MSSQFPRLGQHAYLLVAFVKALTTGKLVQNTVSYEFILNTCRNLTCSGVNGYRYSSLVKTLFVAAGMQNSASACLATLNGPCCKNGMALSPDNSRLNLMIPGPDTRKLWMKKLSKDLHTLQGQGFSPEAARRSIDSLMGVYGDQVDALLDGPREVFRFELIRQITLNREEAARVQSLPPVLEFEEVEKNASRRSQLEELFYMSSMRRPPEEEGEKGEDVAVHPPGVAPFDPAPAVDEEAERQAAAAAAAGVAAFDQDQASTDQPLVDEEAERQADAILAYLQTISVEKQRKLLVLLLYGLLRGAFDFTDITPSLLSRLSGYIGDCHVRASFPLEDFQDAAPNVDITRQEFLIQAKPLQIILDHADDFDTPKAVEALTKVRNCPVIACCCMDVQMSTLDCLQVELSIPSPSGRCFCETVQGQIRGSRCGQPKRV